MAFDVAEQSYTDRQFNRPFHQLPFNLILQMLPTWAESGLQHKLNLLSKGEAQIQWHTIFQQFNSQGHLSCCTSLVLLQFSSTVVSVLIVAHVQNKQSLFQGVMTENHYILNTIDNKAVASQTLWIASNWGLLKRKAWKEKLIASLTTFYPDKNLTATDVCSGSSATKLILQGYIACYEDSVHGWTPTTTNLNLHHWHAQAWTEYTR